MDFEASSSLPSGWSFGAGLDISTGSKLNGANCLRNNNTATSPFSLYGTVDSASGNVVVDAVFMGENIGTNTGFQLVLGCNDSNPANVLTTANSYRVAVAMGSSVTNFVLNRRNAGTDTQIAALNGANQILKAGAKYHLYLTRNGAALKAELQQISDPANPSSDGKWLNTSIAWQTGRTHCMSGTDGTPLASTGGYCGVRLGGPAGAIAYVDDFRISDLTSDGATIDADDANWVDSPGNVDVRSSSLAVLTHWGAERRIGFTGTSCAATFDMSLLTASTMLSANYPKIKWSIDNGPWQEASVSDTVELATGLDDGTHSLRLVLRGAVTFAPGDSSTHFDRWVSPVSAARLTGLTLDVGEASAPVPASLAARSRKILFFGNSMTAGSQSRANLPTSDIDSMDGLDSWAVQVGEALNADVGNCAWNAQSYTGGGTGGVPKFRDNDTPSNSAYMFLTQGRARSFAGITDVFFAHGVIEASDPSSDIVATLTHFRTLLPTGAKMWQLVPFGGRWRDEITAAVASYISDTGDTLASVIDLGERAELGLPENSSLVDGPTLQAHDGYHPNRERHAQLGAMIAAQVQAQESDGGLSAGQIRDAVGLASADLDAKFADLVSRLDAIDETTGKLDSMLVYDEDEETWSFEGSYTSSALAADLRGSLTPELGAIASITTDDRPELGSAPPADADLPTKIDWIFMLLRNRVSQTESAQALYAADGTTVVASAAVSETSDTVTRAGWAT
jgi:hypothetical protein